MFGARGRPDGTILGSGDKEVLSLAVHWSMDLEAVSSLAGLVALWLFLD